MFDYNTLFNCSLWLSNQSVFRQSQSQSLNQSVIGLLTFLDLFLNCVKVAEKAETNKESVEASDKSKEPGCDVSQRDISSAYCAIAEIFLTDAWYVQFRNL